MSRGHIRRRGRRSWELKFDASADALTGNRRIRYVSFKGTRREAALELARLVVQEAAGEGINPAKTTLGEFLDRWERGWAELNVSPKTFERYSELLRRHVRPHIGHVRIQRVRAVMLADLYAKLLRETGLAARTVGHVDKALRCALGHAVQWAVIAQNPADNVSPPPVRSAEVQMLRSGRRANTSRSVTGPQRTLALHGRHRGTGERDSAWRVAGVKVERRRS
jgi:Phage integrase, N-terminal SAM-like domain